MNVRELQVLEALNIASTRYARPGHGFEATADQVAETLRGDERVGPPIKPLWGTVPYVGVTLRDLRNTSWMRREPLVEKLNRRSGTTRWRLTRAGVRVLAA